VICRARAGKDGSDGAIYFELTEIKEDFSCDDAAVIVKRIRYLKEDGLSKPNNSDH